MRLRSKTTTEPYAFKHYRYNTSDPSVRYDYSPPPHNIVTGVEDFYDEPGGNKKAVKPCYHQKSTTEFFPFSGTLKGWFGDVFVWEGYKLGSATNLVFLPPRPDITTVALNAITPKLKADMSLPNFIFELKDLRRIIPDMTTIQRTAAALTAIATNPFKGGRRWGVSELSNTVASQHLNAAFGYLPLIDDAFKLVSSINDFNRRLADFKSHGSKLNTGYFKKVYPAELLLRKTENNVMPLSRFRTEHHLVDDSLVCGIKYRYTIPMGPVNVPDIFLKYIGFRSNPRILWDAIPFSFIIDWFFGVGKFLEQFDPGAIPVQMHIESAWLTRHSQVQVKTFLETLPDPYGVNEWKSGGGLTSRTTIDYYDRKVIDINPSLLGSLNALALQNVTKNKVMLGLSLGKVLTHRG